MTTKMPRSVQTHRVPTETKNAAPTVGAGLDVR
jgi:hypothetical protein